MFGGGGQTVHVYPNGLQARQTQLKWIKIWF